MNPNESFVILTIIQTKGSTPREVGAKMRVTESSFEDTIGGGRLELLAIERARELIKSGSSQKFSFPLCTAAGQCCGGFVELFAEVIRPTPKLFIFGAGHVGQAITQVMSGTGYDLTVIDSRDEWLSLLPKDIISIQDSGQKFIEEYPHWSSDFSHALVLTHEHKLDEQLIALLCTKKLKYIGLIGSETKWQRFQSRLKGVDTKLVKCPMGLKIGGKAPKEVAISIAAELVQLKNNKEEIAPQPFTAEPIFDDHAAFA